MFFIVHLGIKSPARNSIEVCFDMARLTKNGWSSYAQRSSTKSSFGKLILSFSFLMVILIISKNDRTNNQYDADKFFATPVVVVSTISSDAVGGSVVKISRLKS